MKRVPKTTLFENNLHHRKMKQILLLPIIFALFLFPVLAQGDESQSAKIDSSLKCRIFGEDIVNLLFKSVEQEAPNSKTSYQTSVCENGDAVTYLYRQERESR